MAIKFTATKNGVWIHDRPMHRKTVKLRFITRNMLVRLIEVIDQLEQKKIKPTNRNLEDVELDHNFDPIPPKD